MKSAGGEVLVASLRDPIARRNLGLVAPAEVYATLAKR